jgi:hypothetical protein
MPLDNFRFVEGMGPPPYLREAMQNTVLVSHRVVSIDEAIYYELQEIRKAMDLLSGRTVHVPGVGNGVVL